MRSAASVVAACILSIGASCPKPHPPDPHPTPTPSPSPSAMQPLKVVGNKFSPEILGAVSTHGGWPLLDTQHLDQIAQAHLNYTAMRLPCIVPDDRGASFETYERAAGDPSKWDLSKFSAAFDANLAATIAHAESKGIYVNLGLWDGWCAVHGELFLPWRGGHNVNGIDLGYCSDFGAAPTATHLALVKHVVGLVGRHNNVIFELGNEANRCNPSQAFIDGIRGAVRGAEAEFHQVRHLWSPGTFESGMLGSEFDFISYHGNPQPAQSVPVEVNEFSPQGKAQYLANLARAKQLGTVYNFWHDDPPDARDWDDPTWEQEWLDTLKAMTSTAPTTGCSNIPDDPYTKALPRWVPPEYVDQVNAALNAVTGPCDSPCVVNESYSTFLPKVAEALRQQGLCAGIQVDSEGPVDELCVGDPVAGANPPRTDRCQGQHLFACKPDGCHHGTVAYATKQKGSNPDRPYGPLRDTWVRTP